MMKPRHLLTAGSALLLSFTAHAEQATQPELSCQVTYASQTETLLTGLSADPYTVKAADIAGRFRFKAVMQGKNNTINYIKLYVYLQNGDSDIPVHQASYSGPFPHAEQAYRLTPHNTVYAGPLERMLQYECLLHHL